MPGPAYSVVRLDFSATGSPGRTHPLWGIGLTPAVSGTPNVLDDGRAQSLLEAILWHGRQATAARQSVQHMSATDRHALLAFLNSL